jgi:O-antigen ligase
VAVAVLVCALAAGIAAAVTAERGPSREASAQRLASAQSNRYEYWQVAVRTFADHPLAGVGAGGFQAEWLRERPFRESVRDAHSLYLETLAELGLVGFAALLTLFAGVALGARRARAAAATAACAAWAFHAGLDWDWEMPALTLVALVLAARLLAAAEEPPGPPPAPPAPAG